MEERTRSLDLAWIANNAETVKNVIAEVMSAETREDFDALKETITLAVGIVFDLLDEPLRAMGVELPMQRGLKTLFAIKVHDEVFKKLLGFVEKIEEKLEEHE